MDYKYIEQLLEAYWTCQTTLEEERILRTFFQQETLPEHLAPYRTLFCYEADQQHTETLGDAFDAAIMAKIGAAQRVQARRVSWWHSLRPLCRAAAAVAIILTVGETIEGSFNRMSQPNGALPGSGLPLSTVTQPRTDSSSIARQAAIIATPQADSVSTCSRHR